MPKRISVNQYFLLIAKTVSMRSTCIDKQVGCVLVNRRNEILATGYNGPPHGQQHCIDLGYCIKDNGGICPSTHAEQNAILQCRDISSLYKVYLTLSPCINCVRLLLNTNCKHIYFIHEHKHAEARQLWRTYRNILSWKQEELKYGIGEVIYPNTYLP